MFNGTNIKEQIIAYSVVILTASIFGIAIILLTSGNFSGALPFALIFLLGYTYLFRYFPKETLLALSFFLLFQNIIANNLYLLTANETLVGVFKNLDEALILYSFIFIVITKRFSLRRTPINYPLLVFLSVGIISSVSNHVPVHVFSFGAFLMIKGFLVFYIFSHIDFQESDLKRYARWMGIAASVFLFCGFIDLIAPSEFRRLTGNRTFVDYRFNIPGVQSLFIHPGVFGWFMAYMAVFAFAFYFIFRKRYYLILGLFFSVGSFFSMRRKSLGGIFAGIASGIFNMPLSRKLKVGIPVIIVISLAAVTLLPKIIGLFGNMLERYVYVTDPMQNARNALYITSGRIAMDYFPLGAGFGRYGGWISRIYYSHVYDKYGLSYIHGMSEEKASYLMDTFWPHILGELGVVGFVFYIAVIFRLLHMSWRASKLLSTPFSRAFALGTAMVFVEALVESIAQPVFEAPPQMFFIFASVGITFSLYSKEIKN